jgi:hypothetical protein
VKLTRYLKFLPLLAIFAFGVVLISMPDDTEATPLGAPSLSLTIVPLNGSTVVTAVYTDDTPAGSANAVLTASPAIGTFLSPGTLTPLAAETVTVSGATVTVTEDADTLANQKTLTANFQCQQYGTTTFTISHGGTTSPASVSLFCGDYGGQYPGYPGGYPGYPGYPGGYPSDQYPNYPVNPGTISAVTVSASPASTTCASPATISVTVKDSAGNLVTNGTSVTVSASTGTVSPNVVSTSGGYATTTFTAPDNSNGTATVTATAGTGTGYATVAFSCTGGSTTSPASPVYPPSYDYPSGPVSIMPPNTGDAGLAQNARTTSNAGMALVALSLLGVGAGAMKLRQQHIER